MPELLLVNPRPRRKARRDNPTPAQRRARAAFAAASRARAANPRRRKARRRNPIPPGATAVMHGAPARRRPARRRNPVPPLRSRRSRRRNPINLGSASSYMSLLKQSLIGGAGAVAVDVAMGYITPYLPATLQRTPGQVGIGDAVKAVITVALGKVLDKPTKGLSMQAARGSLIVQSHALIAQMLPGTMQLGYAVPARVVNMSNRIGPNRLNRYTAPGQTQLLNRYTAPGQTQLLNGRASVMARESVIR